MCVLIPVVGNRLITHLLNMLVVKIQNALSDAARKNEVKEPSILCHICGAQTAPSVVGI